MSSLSYSSKHNLGKWLRTNSVVKYYYIAEPEDEAQVSFVTIQDSKEGKPATYSNVDPPPGRDAVPLSYFVNLRSRRNTSDSVSESAKCEENELRPIEQEMNSSISTSYTLMK